MWVLGCSCDPPPRPAHYIHRGDFATSVGVVALLSSAFALPFGLSQPFLGLAGDALGKAVVIKVAVAVLALCLLATAWPLT